MHIVLDSNILIRDHWLRGKWLQKLVTYARATGSHIVLLEPVIVEVRSNFVREVVNDRTSRLIDARDQAARRGLLEIPDMNRDLIVERTIRARDKAFERFCSGPNVLRIDFTDPLLRDAFKRYSYREPPSRQKAKDSAGVKDVIIWLMLLEEAKKEPNWSDIAIISNDGAFGDNDGLAANLASDVPAFTSLTTYTSIEEFIKRNAHTRSAYDIDWFRARLEWMKVTTRLTNYFETLQDYSVAVEYQITDPNLSRYYQAGSIPDTISELRYDLTGEVTYDATSDLYYVDASVQIEATVICSKRLELEDAFGDIMPLELHLNCRASESVTLVLRLEDETPALVNVWS